MGRHGLSAAATLSPAKKIGHFEDHLKDFKRKQEVLWADRDTHASEQLSWKFHATGPRSLTPPAKGKLCWIISPLICPGMQGISRFTCYAQQSNEFLDRKALKVCRKPIFSWAEPMLSTRQIGTLQSRRKIGNSVRGRSFCGHSLFLDSV